MELFTPDIETLAALRRDLVARHGAVETVCTSADWPLAEGKGVILGIDTGVELGNPHAGSLSYVLWTGDGSPVTDGRVTIAGPDIPEAGGQSLPLGKLVLVKVEGMTAENCLQRQRQMEHARYSLMLEGYTVRVASGMFREWARVHRDAVERGFSLSMVAARTREILLELDFVSGVECIFITSQEAMRQLAPAAGRIQKIYDAIFSVENIPVHECDSCSNNEICSEVDAIRDIHDAAVKEAG